MTSTELDKLLVMLKWLSVTCFDACAIFRMSFPTTLTCTESLCKMHTDFDVIRSEEAGNRELSFVNDCLSICEV